MSHDGGKREVTNLEKKIEFWRNKRRKGFRL